MSLSRDTLQLLLLTQTQNDAEQLVSLMRNSGFSTRARTVITHEQFEEALKSAQWDVVVADPDLENIEFTELLSQIHRLNYDIPLILIPVNSSNALLESALTKGASAVVAFDESNILMQTIRREVEHLRNRQEVRLLKVKLRDAEKRSRTLLESSRDPIAYIHDGMHVHANSAYLEMFGYESVEDLEGMPVMDMIASDSQASFKDFLKQYRTGIPDSFELETTGVLPDGEQFPMTMSFSDATYSDEPCNQIQISRRDTESELAAELTELRHRDAVTQLHNKEYFLERLTRAVDHAVLEKQYSTLVYAEINGFDTIRRDVGIESSDTVIREISQCLSSIAHEYDVTARISDDTFIWMMPGGDPAKARQQAQKLISTVNNLLIDLEQRTVQPTLSLGITLITDASPVPTEILQQAHLACDAAAEENKQSSSSAHLFMPEDKSEARQTRSMEKQITTALSRNQLRLLFQPLISMRGDDAEHYEVLLRLPGGDASDPQAGAFINSAEVSDTLKRKLDRWVILHATKLLSERQKQGKDTKLFINITGASLRDEKLPAWVQVALKAAGLNHNAIIFQFSEEDAVRYAAPAKRFCYLVRALGISTAVSRFGCELEPMRLLQQVDIDYVKVDGSYIREIGGDNANGNKALKELLGEVHEAGKISIAPFIESSSTVANIWHYSVHFIQGYYVQAPQADMTYDFSEE